MKPVSTTPDSLPRIIIVGGGFGGLAAARALKKARAHVNLIDKTNHHVFQPLLYQVATGLLSPEHIAPAPPGAPQAGKHHRTQSDRYRPTAQPSFNQASTKGKAL